MTDIVTIDYARLRRMTIGQLLDAFEYQEEESTTSYLEPAVNALLPILHRVATLYDDIDSVRECAFAAGITSMTLEASIEETTAEEVVEKIIHNIVGLALYLLMADGAESWDAQTIKALKAIRNACGDYDDDDDVAV